MILTQKRLKELFDYNPNTGKWVRKLEIVKQRNGYQSTVIDGKYYYLHRLAFLYMTGEFPKEEVDHINKDKLDTSWTNLREVSSSQNKFNKGKHARNKSGYKGVCWCKRSKKWEVSIVANKKKHFLGYFDDIKEAAKKYNEGALIYHGEFANLNVLE